MELYQCPNCEKQYSEFDNIYYCPICRYRLKKVDPESIQKNISVSQATEKSTVTCLYCHSTNTKKISGTRRFMSTGIFGLGSKTIGKQWHCNNCKSDF